MTWAIALIAMLYASVGHGGASGYLALMALYNVVPETMRSSALLLNCCVASIAFYHFYQYFRFTLFYPFILTALPMVYLGASLPAKPHYYQPLLGLCLLIATLRLLGLFSPSIEKHRPLNVLLAAFLGAFIGLLSGFIGIGGGILLSPILLLFHWADAKEAAAISSLFIVINSLMGLTTLYLQQSFHPNPDIGYWMVAALVGGALGSYCSAFRLPTRYVKHLLAGVLLLASVKLLIL